MAQEHSVGKLIQATKIRRTRRLPIPGVVRVRQGEQVQPDSILAAAAVPGQLVGISLASKLDVTADVMERYMLRKVGDKVKEGDELAVRSGLFGLSKSVVYAPASGTIETISAHTGIVTIRKPDIPVLVDAYIAGTVVRILPDEGAEVEAEAVFLQGVFGVGGEQFGQLVLGVERPDQVLTLELVPPDLAGCILVAGAKISRDALQKAVHSGAVGVIAGGIDDHDLTDFVGYQIGVPITGQEEVGLTLVLTEGFGQRPMQAATFEALTQSAGKQVSINGTTHLRSNLIKPEVILPVV